MCLCVYTSLLQCVFLGFSFFSWLHVHSTLVTDLTLKLVIMVIRLDNSGYSCSRPRAGSPQLRGSGFCVKSSERVAKKDSMVQPPQPAMKRFRVSAWISAGGDIVNGVAGGRTQEGRESKEQR